MPTPDDNKVAFQESLLEWFEREHRDFPWRLRSDPYAILIAEKLLQQTAARAPVVAAYEDVGVLTKEAVSADLHDGQACTIS